MDVDKQYSKTCTDSLQLKVTTHYDKLYDHISMDNSIIVYIVDEYVRNYQITSQEGRICWLKNNTVMTKMISQLQPMDT